MNKYKLLMVVAEAAVCYAALAVVAGCRHVPDGTVMTLAMADAILKWREGGDGSYSSLSVAAVKSMQAFGLLYPYAGYGGASHGNMRRTFRFGFCNGS